MTITIAQLKAVVTADTSAAETNLNNVTKATKEVATEMTTTGNSMRSVLGGIGNFLSGAFGEAMEFFQGALPEITRIVGEAQTLEIALSGLGQPVEELVGWMGDLERTRGYDDQDIKGWYLAATNMGIESDAAKELISGLTDLGVVNGLTASEIGSIVDAFGLMNESGKLSERVFTTLGKSGASLRGALAGAFDVPATEVQGMLKDGLIPMNEVLEEFNGWLGGSAEKAEQWEGTIPGITAKAKGLRESVTESLFKGAVDTLSPLASSILDQLSGTDFQEGFRSAGEQIGTALKAGMTGAGVTLDSLFAGGALGGVSEFIEKFQSGAWESAISDLVIGVQFGVMEAAAQIKSVGLTLWEVGSFVVDTIEIFITQLSGFMGELDNKLNIFAALQDWAAAGGAVNPLATIQLGKELLSGIQKSSGETFEMDLSGIGTAQGAMAARLAEIGTSRDTELAAIAMGKQAALDAAEKMRSAPVMPSSEVPWYAMQTVTPPGGAGLAEVDQAAAAETVKVMKGALVAELATASGEDPSLIGAMLSSSEISDEDVSAFMPGFLKRIDKAIVDNKQELDRRGRDMWHGLGGGFVDEASTDPTFQRAIAAMTAKALESILTD